MLHSVLVVTNQEEEREQIRDVLDSLGHEYDFAPCQEEAREWVQEKIYSYFILNLNMPVKRGRQRRVQNGTNFIDELRRMEIYESVPIIAIVPDNYNFRFVVKAYENETEDYIADKYLIKSELSHLDGQIKKLLRTHGHNIIPYVPDHPEMQESFYQLIQPSEEGQESGFSVISKPGNFDGGEMVFYPDKVELCGFEICGTNCQAKRILEELRSKGADGEFVALSGAQLADAIGCESGQNGISSAINELRRTIADAMYLGFGVIMKNSDVILSGGPGYRLSENITVKIGDEGIRRVKLHNARQQWIVDSLRSGVRLQMDDIKRKFDCSVTTIKRDLQALRDDGDIEFVGPAKTGYYRFKKVD